MTTTRVADLYRADYGDSWAPLLVGRTSAQSIMLTSDTMASVGAQGVIVADLCVFLINVFEAGDSDVNILADYAGDADYRLLLTAYDPITGEVAFTRDSTVASEFAGYELLWVEELSDDDPPVTSYPGGFIILFYDDDLVPGIYKFEVALYGETPTSHRVMSVCAGWIDVAPAVPSEA